jgi:hypothetical protein
MTDLDLITDLRPEVRLPDTAELAPARSRLAAAITAEITAADSPAGLSPAGPWPGDRAYQAPVRAPRAGSRWTSRRLALTGVAAAAVAAGVAAALVIAPGAGGKPASQPAGTAGAQPGGVGSQSGSGVQPFTGHLTAARFLHAAAHAALQQPSVPPRPGQFVYSESEGPGGTAKYQIWQSTDGSKRGLVVNSTGPIGLDPCPVAKAEAGQCSVQAGYLPDLPAKPGAVLGYLTKIGLADPALGHKPIPNWEANDVGKTVESLLSNTYLLPAQRAALFEYMARTPGYTVAPHAVDAAGRHGIAIEWKYEGMTTAVIFSPKTYAYLGNTITSGARTIWSAAEIKFEVVDSLPPNAFAGVHTKVPLKPRQGSTPQPGSTPSDQV